jgi:hypothetical protein
MKKVAFLLCWSLMVFVLLMTASCHQNKGQIILINNSNEVITLAHIEICNQVIEIENIKPNEQAIGSFKIKGDSHYDIVIKFASGKVIKKQTGYVSYGFDYQQHTLSITEANITIINSQVE